MSAKTSANDWQTRKERARLRSQWVADHGPACPICGGVPRRGLDYDHDHKTDAFRGFICWRCNKYMLPHWVTPEILRRAAEYLEQ